VKAITAPKPTPVSFATEPYFGVNAFLIDELGDRLLKGPAKFRLVAQLAAEGDPVNDATAVWPDDGHRKNAVRGTKL
jgi:hypothetical protein